MSQDKAAKTMVIETGDGLQLHLQDDNYLYERASRGMPA